MKCLNIICILCSFAALCLSIVNYKKNNNDIHKNKDVESKINLRVEQVISDKEKLIVEVLWKKLSGLDSKAKQPESLEDLLHRIDDISTQLE